MDNLTPYEQGQQACKDGESIFDYPYRPNTKDYNDWMEGFMDQDKIIAYGG